MTEDELKKLAARELQQRPQPKPAVDPGLKSWMEDLGWVQDSDSNPNPLTSRWQKLGSFLKIELPLGFFPTSRAQVELAVKAACKKSK